MSKNQRSVPIFSPDFSIEKAFSGPVCGIDEAGRGPLAGPVVAAAVILRPDNCPADINDSKRISPIARERLLNAILETSAGGIGMAQPEEIDQLNILAATMLAMKRAYEALPEMAAVALIDGNHAPDLPCQMKTIIKGDQRSLSIAAASIVAKVTRDRIMVEAGSRYPGYGYSQHKGYPTAAHRAALNTLGPSPIHRFSYRPVQVALSLKQTKT